MQQVSHVCRTVGCHNEVTESVYCERCQEELHALIQGMEDSGPPRPARRFTLLLAAAAAVGVLIELARSGFRRV
jgi:hypothetical protein